MKCVRVMEPKRFDEQVKDALGKSSAVFVLFFGREKPETGESWCPDCVIADPIVRKAVGTKSDSILLEVPVDRSTDQESETNLFRQREDVKLNKVPTLLRWTNNGPASTRLEEDECQEKNILEYISKTDA